MELWKRGTQRRLVAQLLEDTFRNQAVGKSPEPVAGGHPTGDFVREPFGFG